MGRSQSLSRLRTSQTMSNKAKEALFSPYTLGDLKLKNRIVMAPLTRTRAENQGKVPNELMAEYYAQRAGAGLIITEGTFVSEQGQGWYGAPGVYSEEQAAGWERVTDAVHRAGGLIFVQLWHQGSVSHRSLYDDGRLPLGPSAVNPEQLIHVKGGRIMSETPREMSLQDIKQAVKRLQTCRTSRTRRGLRRRPDSRRICLPLPAVPA